MTNLSGANLNNTILREANLGATDLTGADLSDADLRGAKFENVNLDTPDLRKYPHSNAWFTQLGQAILAGADLSGTNLGGAYLTQANLTKANLRGADLRETTGLKLEQVNQADTDDKTQLPYLVTRDQRLSEPKTQSKGTEERANEE